jgi:hypothetical protein
MEATDQSTLLLEISNPAGFKIQRSHNSGLFKSNLQENYSRELSIKDVKALNA